MTKLDRFVLLRAFYKSVGMPELTFTEMNELQNAAYISNRNALALCNDAIDQETYDRRMKSVRKRLSFLTLPFTVHGDPLGHCLRIQLPNGDELCPGRFN